MHIAVLMGTVVHRLFDDDMFDSLGPCWALAAHCFVSMYLSEAAVQTLCNAYLGGAAFHLPCNN